MLILPTLQECMQAKGVKTYVTSGLDRLKTMHALDQIIRNRFQVLPIQSDPTDPDIQVKYNGIETKKCQVGHIYYGGDQSWFYDDKNDIPEGKKAKYTSYIDLITQNGGCGLIAASDLSLYLYLYHREKFQYKDDSEMSLLKKVNDFIHQEGAPLITVEINDTQNFYYHWVNIVGVITDNIKNCVTLRVQSWGGNMILILMNFTV